MSEAVYNMAVVGFFAGLMVLGAIAYLVHVTRDARLGRAYRKEFEQRRRQGRWMTGREAAWQLLDDMREHRIAAEKLVQTSAQPPRTRTLRLVK